jgi:hypothetical protein
LLRLLVLLRRQPDLYCILRDAFGFSSGIDHFNQYRKLADKAVVFLHVLELSPISKSMKRNLRAVGLQIQKVG